MRAEEEECRACSDFKSYIRQQMKGSQSKAKAPVTETMNPNPSATDRRADESDYEKECPLDRNQLGRRTWSFLHTMAAYYPEQASPKQQQDMKQFLQLFGQFYPCSYCADDYLEDIGRHPPRVRNRFELSEWLCEIHNLTNQKLNKPLFDCSKVLERWRTGWKNGSCG